MAMKKCPDCGKEYSTSAKACVHCGAPNRDSPGRKAGRAVGVVALSLFGVFALMIVYGALVARTPEAKERRIDRAAIEVCDQMSGAQKGQRSFNPTCAEMRSRFREKWGRNP